MKSWILMSNQYEPLFINSVIELLKEYPEVKYQIIPKDGYIFIDAGDNEKLKIEISDKIKTLADFYGIEPE